MAQWLNALIRKIEPGTLYIDIGANLGIHELHAAKANCTVWIVEPQELNLQKVSDELKQNIYCQKISKQKHNTHFCPRLFTPAFFRVSITK